MSTFAATCTAIGLLSVGLPGLCPAQEARPAVTFLRPQSGTPLFDQVDVEVAIESDLPIERAELRFDGAMEGARTRPPWRWTLDVGSQNRDRRFFVDVVTAGGVSTRAELFVPRFESDAEIDIALRQLYVTVTNRRRERVLDLRAADFTVTDQGAAQKLVTFEGGDIPFTAVLLIDGSQSMKGPPLELAVRGARRFVANMGPYDETKIMIFGDRLTATSPWGGPDDSLAKRLETLVSGIDFFGGSAIYDHLFLALLRAETRQGRRVVILLSDGSDLHSVLKAEQVEEAARRSQALVYVIRHSQGRAAVSPRVARFSMSSGPGQRREYQLLEDVAKATGGRVLTIESIDQVEAALQEILRELREQYALGYSPATRTGDPGDPVWHTVKVEVNRSGLEVRSRGSYVED
jgi:VWFA-related protein